MQVKTEDNLSGGKRKSSGHCSHNHFYRQRRNSFQRRDGHKRVDKFTLWSSWSLRHSGQCCCCRRRHGCNDKDQIREEAESELLALFMNVADWALTHRRRAMQSLIGIINATAKGILDAQTSIALSRITEVIDGILSASLVVPGSPEKRENRRRDDIHKLDDLVSK